MFSPRLANGIVTFTLIACVILGIELRQIRVERYDREQYWAEILRSNEVGRWSWTDGGKLVWDQGMHDLFRVSRTQFDGTIDGFLACVCEADRDEVRARCMESAESGVPYDLVYRLTDGRRIRARGRVVVVGGVRSLAGICTPA